MSICQTAQATYIGITSSDFNILLQVFPLLVTLLASESNVVHTYAAVAVERLLSQKVRVP